MERAIAQAAGVTPHQNAQDGLWRDPIASQAPFSPPIAHMRIYSQWRAHTGRGFHAGPGSPLAEALEDATSAAIRLDDRPGDQGCATLSAATQPNEGHPAVSRSVYEERGEGIGLSIVKRLCDLLDASLEMESDPNQGTVFRVLFPRSYQDC